MKRTRWRQISGVKCCPSSPLPCRIHSSIFTTISFSLATRNMWNMNGICSINSPSGFSFSRKSAWCVLIWDIICGFPKAEKEKGLREKLRTSFDSQGRLICHKVNNEFRGLQCAEHSFCRIIRQLMCCSHVFHHTGMIQKSLSQTTHPNRLCAFLWRASGLGSAVDHVDHCRIVFE